MRKLTDCDLANIAKITIEGYHVEAVRIKRGPFADSDHYGIILGKNAVGHYVTWQFHLLDDNSISAYWGHYFMEDRNAAIRDFDIRDKNTTPQKFKVTITETLKRTVEVEAGSQHEAEQIVSEGWYNNEYIIDNILDADNFIDVDFKAVPMTSTLVAMNAEEQ